MSERTCLLLLGLLAVACLIDLAATTTITTTSPAPITGVQNPGKDCWTQCGKKDGPCPNFCGDGFCCRHGWARGGCTGHTGKNFHSCVKDPKDCDDIRKDCDARKAKGLCWRGGDVAVCMRTCGKCDIPDDIPLLSVPDIPMDCNQNASTKLTCHGKCPIANNAGLSTYIFKVGTDPDEIMCFHTFIPESKKPMPVVLQLQCYAKNRNSYSYFEFRDGNSPDNWAARRTGYARIGLSHRSGGWGGKWNLKDAETWKGYFDVNDPKRPMHICQTMDLVNADGVYAQPKMQYVKRILEWLVSQPEKFDTSKIFLKGFSQNGAWGTEMIKCFSDIIAGGWVGGPGGRFPNGGCTPEMKKARQWPCYQKGRPLTFCSGVYWNDFIYKRSRGPREPYKMDMEDSAKCAGTEGIKATHFDFLNGRHWGIKNSYFWMQSCFGIGTPCSTACEEKFTECMKGLETLGESYYNFPKCVAEMDELEVCKGCSPTLNMLRQSEKPMREVGIERFGETYPPTGDYPRPKTSVCEWKNGRAYF